MKATASLMHRQITIKQKFSRVKGPCPSLPQTMITYLGYDRTCVAGNATRDWYRRYSTGITSRTLICASYELQAFQAITQVGVSSETTFLPPASRRPNAVVAVQSAIRKVFWK